MGTLTVLTVGVSLVFGLHAMDVPDGHASDWSSRNDAAQTAMQQHKYDDAIQLFGECLGLARTPAEHITALTFYGIALNLADRPADARPALEQALAKWGDAPDDYRVAASAVLASVDRRLGDYQSAENILREAIADNAPGEKYRASLMVDLGSLLVEEGRDSEAALLLHDAGQVNGLTRQQHINILVETADLLREMRRWDESIALWNEIGASTSGDHVARLEAVVAGGLGHAWFDAGNLARAEPLLRRALQLTRDDPGATLTQTVTAITTMASLYIEEDKLALAEETLSEAIVMEEASLGPMHPQVAVLLEMKAAILSRRGEAQPARDELERARFIMSSHFGPDSIAVAGVLATLGDIEQRANRPEAAAEEYGIAMRMMRDAGDRDGFGPALVTRYAAALKAAHRPAEARALLRNADAGPAPAASPAAGVQSFRAN